MSDFVVGEKECEIAEVVIWIGHSCTSPSDADLTQLMRYLGTKNKEITEKIKNRQKYTLSIQDCIEIILTEWRNRVSKEAKLSILIDTLQKMDLNESANTLRDHFVMSSSNERSVDGSCSKKIQVHDIEKLLQSHEQSNTPIIPPESTHGNISFCKNETVINLDNDTRQSEKAQKNFQKSSPHHEQNSEHVNLLVEERKLTQPKNKSKCMLVRALPYIISVALAASLVIVYQKNQTQWQSDESFDSKVSMAIIGVENKHFNSTDLDRQDDMSTRDGEIKDYADDQQINNLVTVPYFLTGKNEAMKELIINDTETLKDLFDPQNKWTNLNAVKFDNHLGSLCRDSTDEAFVEKRYLPKLEYLTLNISNGCQNLIDRVIYSVQMDRLKVFKFIGNINDKKVQQIQEILRRYHKTLEKIHLSGTLDSSIHIFEIRRSSVLSSVTDISIKLDSALGGAVNWGVINDRFCSLFPSLTRFETKNIYISFDEFLKLQKCTHIAYVDTSISIAVKDNVRVEELKWQNQFPMLKNIAAKFEFLECPSTDFFESFRNNAQVFDEYRFCSNCNISPIQGMKCIHDIKAHPLPAKRRSTGHLNI